MLLFDEKQYIPQEPRPYQEDAINAAIAAWDGGETAPLEALATGGGKTTIFAEILRRTVDPGSQRALVVAHTEELVHQPFDRIQNQFAGKLNGYFGELNAPGIGIVMAERNDVRARIVVGTRQSILPRLPQLLRHGRFDVLIIDEAHHAFIDNTYGEIITALRKANPSLRLLGLTATPERGDGQALGSVFTNIVYEWLIPDGIAQGYLVPVTRIKVKTQVDAQQVKTSHGDYAAGQLVSILEASNWLDLCARAFAQHVTPTNRLCLAFMPSVEMSKQFAARLSADGIAAAHLDGEMDKDDRRRILRDYASGKLRAISNMAVLTEGFDAPATSAIFLARPTKSRSLLTQIIGRGLRLHPGKHDCLLIDMTVQDTRALELGSLVGKMVKCPNCKAEYYAGMKACPCCGTAPKVGAGGGGKSWVDPFTGEKLIVNFDALFEQAFAAWHNGDDGFLSCTLSFEDGAYIIVPPLEDEYYRLVHVPRDKKRPLSYMDRNDDLASLMMAADTLVRDRAAKSADKSARWREDPATLGQVEWLRDLGVKDTDNLSKGAAQQLITHKVSVKRFMRESGMR
jgi:superfamily II DNA or RNA helicase